MAESVETSVVIPCYNVDAYLGEALESVRAQTLPVREIVLVDDGSKVPLTPPRDWPGPPIMLIRTPNRGLPAARNLGVSHCTGDLIGFLDADDLWQPTKVESQTKALKANSKAVASYTQCESKPGFFGFGPYPPPDVSDDEFLLVLWYNLFFPPSTVIVRRDVLNDVGGFREDLGNGEDIELWLRLLRRGPFVQISEPLTGYRQHSQQFTKDTAKKMFGSKQSRAAMIAQNADRLIAAGLPREKLWDAYRNDILLVYFRREFGAARRLLFDYWRDHKRDLRILAYALATFFPAGLFSRLRGRTPAVPKSIAGGAGQNRSWDVALQGVRSALAR
jgi:glycosyltransferase involved in cell wall biosynthesis